MRCVCAAVFFCLLAAWAQSTNEQPAASKEIALENSGKPMLAPFQCTEEDIQSFGLECSQDEPCPIYLELSAFEPVGNQLFAAGNIHSAASTLYSILLASSDGGKTWREPFTRMRGATLDRILFIDFEHGWISGQIVNPLPRDPFLLITSDGGKSWRRVPVFEDSRAGSIQRIWFESRNLGNLIFDRGQSGDGPRYELYESATGGDNWMVREASDQPIRIKRMPAETENADWRLRPDAATKANRIEKRQAGRWSSVASFAVSLAPCRPPQAKEPEPPPEPTTEAPAPSAPGTLSLPALRGEPVKKPKK
jgi:photosystem II stability/assembly factor-like uncharacterized protein